MNAKNRRPEVQWEVGLYLFLAIATVSEAPAQIAGVGLSSVRGQRFDNEDLLFFVPEEGDRFATSLAAGDFNGDGVEDLATGVPYDDGLVGSGLTDTGMVIARCGARMAFSRVPLPTTARM